MTMVTSDQNSHNGSRRDLLFSLMPHSSIPGCFFGLQSWPEHIRSAVPRAIPALVLHPCFADHSFALAARAFTCRSSAFYHSPVRREKHHENHLC
jgi:hypothetical protein